MSVEVTYVGHATVLIEVDGVRLLTDPMLRRRVTHLRRDVELDMSPIHDLDAVLVSHGHYDHLDVRSLLLLGRDVRLVVPRGLAGLLRRRGFERVDELDVGEELTVGAVRVSATIAEHGGARVFGPTGAALGFLIRGSAVVYFAGDTDLFPEMDALAAEGIDLALLPVAGWGRKVGAGHLDPERAAEAARRLRPAVSVPIHWGTYSSPGTSVSRASADEFVEAVARVAPDVSVRVVAPGDTLRLA